MLLATNDTDDPRIGQALRMVRYVTVSESGNFSYLSCRCQGLTRVKGSSAMEKQLPGIHHCDKANRTIF